VATVYTLNQKNHKNLIYIKKIRYIFFQKNHDFYQPWCWSMGSFLHLCESHLLFTPVFMTRIIQALSLPRCYYRFSIMEMQTWLQVLSLL